MLPNNRKRIVNGDGALLKELVVFVTMVFLMDLQESCELPKYFKLVKATKSFDNSLAKSLLKFKSSLCNFFQSLALHCKRFLKLQKFKDDLCSFSRLVLLILRQKWLDTLKRCLPKWFCNNFNWIYIGVGE